MLIVEVSMLLEIVAINSWLTHYVGVDMGGSTGAGTGMILRGGDVMVVNMGDDRHNGDGGEDDMNPLL